MIWEEAGARIKKLRLDRKMTQAQFGKLLGISRQHMSKIENGNILSVRQVEHIAAICEKTGVTLDYIVLGIVDPLADANFLDDLTAEQIDISLDVLKKVAALVKTKSGNDLLIKEIMRRQAMTAS